MYHTFTCSSKHSFQQHWFHPDPTQIANSLRYSGLLFTLNETFLYFIFLILIFFFAMSIYGGLNGL